MKRDETVRRGETERDLARTALRRATDGPDPDVGRLLAAVPAMLDGAERRRRSATGGALEACVPLARAMIPRLAAAAIVLVALTAAVLLGNGSLDTGSPDTLDQALLSGGEVTEDLLLETMLGPEDG